MGKDYKKPTDNKIEEMQEPSQMYEGVAGGVFLGDGKGGIGGTVVVDENLVGQESLRQQRVELRTKIGGAVVCAEDDGEPPSRPPKGG